jgi:negative regulator of flagellin synthesis FlgM
MKVMETNVSYARQAYSNESVAQQPETQKAEQQQSNAVPEDKVSLSNDSRDMKMAQEAINAAPEMRLEMVGQLKDAVDQGTYKVDASNIADKMIGKTIDEVV